MPELYHGTSRAFATAMAGLSPQPGSINTAMGRGEFGRGFYTQASIGKARRRGYVLYGINGAVLVLKIDDHAYHALHIRRLTLSGAQRLEALLRSRNAQGTYTTHHDVLAGPLVSQPRIEQQKFQTVNAQTLLNGPRTQRTVLP